MKRLLLILTALGLLIGVMALPARAADTLESPESLTIEDVEVFRNLAESGDSLYVFQYDLAWTSDNFPSTVPASDSILFRLYDSDNTTLKAVDTPYVFSLWDANGYGDGVGAFYFAASDNAPTWGAAVSINIHASPSYFSPSVDQYYTLTADDYTTSTSQADNQEELYNYVLLLCDRLGTLYSGEGITLKTSSDSGIVLSSYGELLFRGSISGLTTLAPDLFFIQVYIPEQMAVQEYDMTLADNYTARLVGTDFEEGFEDIGNILGGISGTLTAGLIFMGLTLLLCLWTIRRGWGGEIGLAGSALIGIFAALVVGDWAFTLVMILSLAAVAMLVYLVLLKRA